jgi:uncharacterized protein involved in cysteine biosynthesis
MNLIGLALLVALCIPIIAIIMDSPFARALAGRLEHERAGKELTAGSGLDELQRRLDALEGEVELLQSSVTRLGEENQFLQQLLEAQPPRSTLPPGQG